MMRLLFVSLLGLFLAGSVITVAFCAPKEKVGEKERCPVCGMFVAKYDAWISQIVHDNGDVFMFDGVKDMLAFYFEPEKYGAKAGISSGALWVKDYYSREWIDGRKCFYVIDSDVYGPMGHEFIPLSSIEAAENFKNDHHGKEILRFEEISLELVKAKRSGQTMKKHK